MTDIDPRRGLLLAAGSALLSACFIIPWKIATTYGKPEEATLVLLTVAATLNSLTTVFSRREAARTAARPLGPTLVLALAFGAISYTGNLFSAEAVLRLSGPVVAVLQRCEVLVVALLGWLLLGERVRANYWVGTAVAGVGLVILSQPAAGASTRVSDTNLSGVLCGLGSALCFGTMAVLTRKHIHAVRPLLLNALRLWCGVAMWFAVEHRIPTRAQLPDGLLMGAGLAGLFGPFLARLCLIYSTIYIRTSTSALIAIATPPLTLVLGFFVLGTVPSARAMLGGTIMLFGIAVPVAGMLRERP